MRGVPSPKHEEKRVDASLLPACNTSTHTVGIPTDDDALLNQLIITQAQLLLAIEAMRLQRGLVVPKVPTASGAGNVATHAVVLLNTANRKGADLVVHHPAHWRTRRNRLLIRPDGGCELLWPQAHYPDDPETQTRRLGKRVGLGSRNSQWQMGFLDGLGDDITWWQMAIVRAVPTGEGIVEEHRTDDAQRLFPHGCPSHTDKFRTT